MNVKVKYLSYAIAALLLVGLRLIGFSSKAAVGTIIIVYAAIMWRAMHKDQ